MSVFNKIINRVRRISTKQLVVAGVFTLAVAGAAGFGLANRQQADASPSIQDCSANSILPCGASNRSEYIKKLNANKPSDLQSIAANFHSDFKLPKSKYSQFANKALQCYAYKKDNTVKCQVNGKEETVMTNAWSIGRHSKPYSKPYKIGNTTFHRSSSSDVFGRDRLAVMVLFDSKGEVEYAVMNACGNQMGGKKVKVTAKCDLLNKKEVGLNKYEFTTNVSTSKLAKVEKVEYFLDGKKVGESKNSGNKYKYTHTFTKTGTITAKVQVKVPGGKITVTSDKCKQKITYKAPFYECTELKATVRNKDDDHTTYRFTAISKQGNGATLKNADFIVNGQVAAKDVTSKENGHIYRDIKLEGGKTYTVEAKVKFTLNGKTVEAKELCKTTVKPKKEVKPYYACDLLRPTALNDELTKFRFTVIASYGNGATLRDADFATWKVGTPADKTVANGVNTRDSDGNIYHELEFEGDGEQRIIEATVNFNLADGVKSVKCKAKITPKEEPKCPLPGKEHLPPNHPECKEDEEMCPIPGKEHLPKDSDECVEPEEPEVPEQPEEPAKELPVTGAGSVAGIFLSATGAGAAAHTLIARRLRK